MNLRDIPLQSPIEEKIRWANQAHQGLAASVAADDRAAHLLDRLASALEQSRAASARTGMGEICRACEREQGGSCCGAGIEDRYDGRLLLINRLLGVRLPERRRFQARCFFLGETGCLLRARHVICVNFVCGNLTRSIDPARLAELREKEGIELEALFRLHDRLTGLMEDDG